MRAFRKLLALSRSQLPGFLKPRSIRSDAVSRRYAMHDAYNVCKRFDSQRNYRDSGTAITAMVQSEINSAAQWRKSISS